MADNRRCLLLIRVPFSYVTSKRRIHFLVIERFKTSESNMDLLINRRKLEGRDVLDRNVKASEDHTAMLRVPTCQLLKHRTSNSRSVLKC